MLNSFSLEKYKGFSDKQIIELKPITLLYGENNSGKSSIARFLPTLNENYKYNDGTFYPIGMLGRTNKNFIYKKSRESSFELNYNDISIKYDIHLIDEEAVITEITITNEERVIEKVSLDLDTFEYFLNADSSVKNVLKNMLPLCSNSELINNIKDKLQKINEGVFWISPLRYIPKPIEVYNKITISYNNNDGSDAVQILARSLKKDNEVFNMVDKWIFKIFKQRLDFSFSGIGDYEVFTTNISSIGHEKIKVPIAESGMGVSQILPILTLCAQLITKEIKGESYIIFENPELHLHDALHKELAEIFAEVISKVDTTKLIIETHSEVLLQAIQLEVVKKTIDFESVSINWVKKIEAMNIVEKIHLNEDGQLDENWPVTAFQTSNNLAKNHVIQMLDKV
jgi:predicted ATPase